MRKITIASAAFAATMILAACTKPAAKEEEVIAPVEAVAEPEATDTEAKPDAAKAGAAAEAPADGAADTAAQGKEHTGGINVAPSN
jgi:cellobiose-specific phosphotransferase system component IIB